MAACSSPKAIVKSEITSPNCHCEGNGKYTIVMDAGMGNWSLFYRPIFHELTNKYKVCLIDRAGYAMDTVSTNSRDAKTMALEINDVLKKNGISDNLILVGHSLGGLHIRMYQSLFSSGVKGMVLLDAAHPNQFERLPKEFKDLLENQVKSLDQVIKLAQKGYLKYGKKKIPTFGIPENLFSEYYNVTTQPEYYYSMKMEIISFENSLKQVENISDLDGLPLLVIGSKNSMDKSILPVKLKNYPFEKHNEVWFELQKELSNLSTHSTFIESNQNHYLNVTDAKLVTEQIILFMKENFND